MVRIHLVVVKSFHRSRSAIHLTSGIHIYLRTVQEKEALAPRSTQRLWKCQKVNIRMSDINASKQQIRSKIKNQKGKNNDLRIQHER